MPAPLLISLPSGLTLGGVQVWAARLLNTLAARNHPCGLILHPPHGPTLDLPLHPSIHLFTAPQPLALSPTSTVAPSHYHTVALSTYRHAVQTLLALTNLPVICVPTQLGDSAGLFAQLIAEGLPARLAPWVHSDIPYEQRILDFYRPVIRHAAAVSSALVAASRATLPDASIWQIPNAVPVSPARPRRLTARPQLIFAGRFCRDIKRVLALPAASQELTRLGVPHSLTIIGDGPAAADLTRACAGLDTITLLPPQTPAALSALFDDHDFFLLPSRVEGLSLSLLESMSRGTVPCTTPTSGASDAVSPDNGLIINAAPDTDEHTVGITMARAIAAALDKLPHMSRAAIDTIHARFSLDQQANHTERFIDALAASPALPWPPNRNPCFTAPSPQGSGAVPANGEQTLRDLLRSLAGRRLIIHATGNHTRELLHVYEEHRAQIAAFADDNPALHGTRLLDLPVIAPQNAAHTRASDVIISSWINQDQVWQRRAVYEQQAMTVHRLYGTANTATPDFAPSAR
jgi:glycosyltransferase involved in cell wall biosynthesis